MATPVYPELHNTDELLVRFSGGDERAFSELFHHLVQPLVFFGVKLTGHMPEAEDAASEALHQLWLRRNDFSSYASMRSFLYTVVQNRCLNFLKHQKVVTTVHRNLLQADEATQANELEGRIVQAETMVAVYKAIEALPDHHRDLIFQSYIEGRSTQEMAIEQGRSSAHIRTARARAVAALRLILKEQNLLQAAIACWLLWDSQKKY